jgi:hypothetical protein
MKMLHSVSASLSQVHDTVRIAETVVIPCQLEANQPRLDHARWILVEWVSRPTGH